jgi:hypothetical protein
VNYHRAIFIRQIADMYHRLPAATAAEVEALRKQATEIVGNAAAVARLMSALDPDATKKAADAGDKSLTDKAPDEVVTKIDLALAAELRALDAMRADAMRAGMSTPFDKVDETGRKLLEKYQKPEEQGQIYFRLLQVHGDSGLQTPDRIINYAQQALKYPLGSRYKLRVYIYWGDTLNLQKTDKPLPEKRKEAAAVYLKGLKLTLQYPETPPVVPNPPPVYEGPEGPEQAASQKAWEHYRELRNKADFIKEVNYDRATFIRQIADMYHRPPAAGATPLETDALRKLAAEILQNDAAVARLMAAIDPDAVRVGNTATEPADQNGKSMTNIAIEAVAGASGDKPRVRVRSADGQLDTERLEHYLNKPAGEWSKPVNSLEARLAIEPGGSNNGTPILATYLELRNVSDSATPIEIAFDPSKIEFKVTDAKGNEVAQAGLPYDGIVAQPGPLRLPHDSQLRLGVSGHGAGIPKDQGALLDLASSAVWLFKRGDTGEYRLQAKFTIAKTSDTAWHGTIELPAVQIPLAK